MIQRALRSTIPSTETGRRRTTVRAFALLLGAFLAFVVDEFLSTGDAYL